MGQTDSARRQKCKGTDMKVTDKHGQGMMYIHILRGFQNEKEVDGVGTGMMGCL